LVTGYWLKVLALKNQLSGHRVFRVKREMYRDAGFTLMLFFPEGKQTAWPKGHGTQEKFLL
jgi:hypothetical protein